MLTTKDIRVLIRDGLKATTDAVVIQAEDGGAKPKYPFTEIKFTLSGRKIGQAAQYMKGTQYFHEQDLEMVLSVNCYELTKDKANDLAFKAFEYFEVHGVYPLQDQHIAIVETTDLTDRTTFLTTQYEHRIGFDVRLRVRTQVLVDMDYIESADIEFELEK